MFFKKDFNKFAHGLQKTMLKYAENLGENNKVVLDYSDGSIKELDKVFPKIVAEFHDAGIRDPTDLEKDEGVQGIAHSLGFYMVECLERNHQKGTWMDTDPVSKEGVWCVVFNNGLVIYPFDWVIKKFIDPKGYSVNVTYAKTVVALEDGVPQ